MTNMKTLQSGETGVNVKICFPGQPGNTEESHNISELVLIKFKAE